MIDLLLILTMTFNVMILVTADNSGHDTIIRLKNDKIFAG